MGLRERLRRLAIQEGKEQPFRNETQRKVMGVAIAAELKRGGQSAQMSKLRALIEDGHLTPEKLRDTFIKQADKQMDEALKKAIKKHQEITVELLLGDTATDADFVSLCDYINLPQSVFEDMARQKISFWGNK